MRFEENVETLLSTALQPCRKRTRRGGSWEGSQQSRPALPALGVEAASSASSLQPDAALVTGDLLVELDA